ncbi:MAG: glycosyltransferase family 4 protein [Bacteroidetes bacterium]|nr:glycosyltransferase family 4 protein [Bacteroidota bacterium]
MNSWGGGEEFICELINSLKNYSFFIASPPGDSFNIFKEKEFNVILIKRLKKYYKINNNWSLLIVLKTFINIIFSFFKLVSLIFTKKINLIIANGVFAGLYSFLPSILTGKKVIIIQHLVYEPNSFEAKLLNILSNFAINIVCVSNSVLDNYKIITNGRDNKHKLIFNSIKIPEQNKAAQISIGKKINIGIIGSIHYIKGIHLIIESLKHYLLSNNDLFLHIYGIPVNNEESKKYFRRLNLFIKENNLLNKVLFHGYINNKDDIYLNLDIVINYSLIVESFSFTVLEAMSYKNIVIAANIGGPKEIIKDGVNGFLIEPDNKKILLEKVKYCYGNIYSKEFNKIRENAFNTVKEKYSLKTFEKQYNLLFNSIIGK